MELKHVDILITLALNLIHIAQSDGILCNMSSFEPCPGENQLCNLTSSGSVCVCEKDYEFVDEQCVHPSQVPAVGHGVTTAIVTIFMLVLLASGVVLVVRKYNLLDLAMQKINARRNNDVMYEDVMIGNDDPPLSP